MAKTKIKKFKWLEVEETSIKIKNSPVAIASHLLLDELRMYHSLKVIDSVLEILRLELEPRGFTEKQILEVLDEVKTLAEQELPK